MSSTSSVGDRRAYEAGDQRNSTDAEARAQKEAERFEEGKENSHNATDPKDERSIANRLAAESKKDQEQDEEKTAAQKDATLPARSHGNEPSKGAKIDQELREEEEAILKKKGDFGPAASN